MNIPKTMSGMRIENQQLVFDHQLAVPSPAKDEVLLRVSHAGLNRADLFQVEGSYAPPEGASPLPGLEVSGWDTESGEPLCALLPGGGYAEYAIAKRNHCLPIPKGLGMAEAATLPEVYATIWLALMHTAQMKEGESVLIHGGSSGIGTAALQWASCMKSAAFTTIRTSEKANLVSQLNATPILYPEEDFVETVKAAGGVDIVLDMVGGDYIARNLKCLKPHGRLVSLALLKGSKTDMSAGSLLLKNLSWHGITLRSRSNEQKAELISALRKHIWPEIEAGNIRPIIDSTFPLNEAEKAHERMRESLHCGKIALKVGAD